jgi:hypothetical protein
MKMLWWLISNFGGYLLGGIAAVAGFFTIKQMGKADAELKRVLADKAAEDAMAAKAAEVRRDVRDLGAAGRRRRLQDNYTRK